MKKTKIVTHNGKAHRDEYLACCVIMFHAYRNGQLSYIERRMVGENDLQCPNTWVVDTGGRWDEDGLNFDHHQDDPAVAGLCAFDLVMMKIMGRRNCDTYRACSPWMKLTAVHDTSGTSSAAGAFGMDIKAYLATRSPIEKAMLSAFAETNIVHSESPLAYVMRETGRMVLLEAEEITADIPDKILLAPPPFYHAGVKVWDIRCAWGDDDHVSMALVNQAASVRSVDVVVGKNNRTGGVGVYRTAWASKKLDLSHIKEMPGVKFVHKNGFYAVITNEVSDTNISEMIKIAVEGVSGAVIDVTC